MGMALAISHRTVAVVTALLLAGAGGATFLAFRWGQRHSPGRAAFHDLRVNHATDYVRMVEPRSPAIRSLAKTLGTPEKAFRYVRDEVRFAPMTPLSRAGEIVAQGRASCLGKAVLLCSLYRALGVPSHRVRVVVGELPTPGGVIDHAWVDVELGGRCLQQDTTLLLGDFQFGDFQGSAYTRYFIRRETFCFNDRGFAVVSQLNGDRWTPPPS